MKLIAASLVAFLLLVPASSAALPDGRAYEQVTPSDKNGGDVGGPALSAALASAFGQVATDGDSIAYISFSSFADAPAAELLTNYVSARSAQGWSTHAISPPAAVPPRLFETSPFRFYAADLSASLLEWTAPTLAPTAPAGFSNLYLRGESGEYLPLADEAPPTVPPSSFRVTFAGATPDAQHVVFEANDALVPGALPGVRSVYEWTPAGIRLVSVLPDETPASSPGAGDGQNRNFTDVISADGSRIFWTDAGQLYVREDGAGTTKLNASQREATLGDGAATLLAIASDGSRAFFTDTTPLTDTVADNGGLYEYDLRSGELRNLTANPGGDPEVLGVVGTDVEGNTVYFVARAALVAGATAGAPNLYVSRLGEVAFIGTLGADDSAAWSPGLETHSGRVTPDGEHLVFISTASLTGYDNADAVTGSLRPQAFLYEATDQRLTCPSCNPTGARPIGGASLPPAVGLAYLPRVLTDDGSRIFFNSGDALVATDSDRKQDVYEYVDGAPQLISSGTSPDLSSLVDVTSAGRDVFFTSRARLVSSDTDNGSDIYDARIAGGFSLPAEPLPCIGEACRGPLTPTLAVNPPVATDWRAESHPPTRRKPRCRKGRRFQPAASARAGKAKHRCGRRGGR